MNDLIVKCVAFSTALAVVVAFSALLAYPYMILWNQLLVPAVTILKPVEWGQMWGIAILINGLFKSSK